MLPTEEVSSFFIRCRRKDFSGNCFPSVDNVFPLVKGIVLLALLLKSEKLADRTNEGKNILDGRKVCRELSKINSLRITRK